MRFVLILLVFALACNTAKQTGSLSGSSDVAQLDGSWELNYVSGPRIAFEGLYPKKKPTLIITSADKRISGNSSCNSYSGTVVIDGFSIRIPDGVASTKMGCEGEGESVYFQTLKKIDRWTVTTNGKTLELYQGDVSLMRFSKK